MKPIWTEEILEIMERLGALRPFLPPPYIPPPTLAELADSAAERLLSARLLSGIDRGIDGLFGGGFPLPAPRPRTVLQVSRVEPWWHPQPATPQQEKFMERLARMQLRGFSFPLTRMEVRRTQAGATFEAGFTVPDRVLGTPIDLAFTCALSSERDAARELRRALMIALMHELDECLFEGNDHSFDPHDSVRSLPPPEL